MRDHRGFTLIEVLVAAAVLGITATALFGLLSQSSFNLRKIEDLHRYELAAQDVMNRALLLSALPLQGEAAGNVDNNGARWTLKVRPWASVGLDSRPQQAIMKIDVTVTWRGRSSQRSIQVESLKAAAIAYSNYDIQSAIEAVFPQ